MRNHFVRLIASVTLTFSILTPLTFIQAASLTQTQISAILGLMQSFGADQSVITSVNASLGGAPITPTSTRMTTAAANTTLGSNSGFASMSVSPNTQNVKIGSFTLQAGDTITVTNIAVLLTGSSSLTNISNLRVSDAVNPIGQPVALNNFPVNYVIQSRGSKTIDVYADVSTLKYVTIIPTVTVTYRSVTASYATTTQSVAGPLLFVGGSQNYSQANSLSVALDNSSPTSQYIVGGTTGLNLTNFRFFASTSDSVLKRIKFNVIGNNTIAAVTVGGITKSVVGGVANVDGLSITIPANTGVTVPVSVNLASVTSQSGNSGTTVQLSVAEAEYLSGSQTNTFVTSTLGSTYTLVGTKPTLTVSGTTATGLVINGETKLGEVTIAADPAGDVRLKQIVFTSSYSGFSTYPTSITGVFLTVGGNGTIAINGSNCNSSASNSYNFSTTCTFPSGYTIAAGISQTLSLRGTLNGGVVAAGAKGQVSTSVLPASSFIWDDLKGAVNGLTGGLIYSYPTSSYTLTTANGSTVTPTTPSVPTGATASCANGTVTASWNAVSGTTEYLPRVYPPVGTSCPSGWTLWTDGRLCYMGGTTSSSQGTSALSTTFTPASAGDYSFWVHAKNSAGTSANTSPLSFSCAATPTTVPTPTPAPQTSTIAGYIDDVRPNGDGTYSVLGWACSTGRNESISVHLYIGGTAGAPGAVLYTAGTANLPSEPGIASACGTTGTNYRFSLQLGQDAVKNYAGKLIVVHGISPVGAPNAAIYNLQNLVVPQPTASAAIQHSLAEGWTGKEVVALQNALSSLGLFKEKVTGYFGNSTKTAVQDLQTQNNVASVGVVGPKTRELLQKLFGI